MNGSRRSLPQLRQGRGDPVARPHRDDHRRDLGVGPEEPRPRPASGARAVDAEQYGCAGDPPAVQQLGDRDEPGLPPGALVATNIDGQLGGLPQLIGQADLAQLAGQHAGPLERDKAAALDLQHPLEQRLDPRPAVDRDRDDRKVLR